MKQKMEIKYLPHYMRNFFKDEKGHIVHGELCYDPNLEGLNPSDSFLRSNRTSYGFIYPECMDVIQELINYPDEEDIRTSFVKLLKHAKKAKHDTGKLFVKTVVVLTYSKYQFLSSLQLLPTPEREEMRDEMVRNIKRLIGQLTRAGINPTIQTLVRNVSQARNWSLPTTAPLPNELDKHFSLAAQLEGLIVEVNDHFAVDNLPERKGGNVLKRRFCDEMIDYSYKQFGRVLSDVIATLCSALIEKTNVQYVKERAKLKRKTPPTA